MPAANSTTRWPALLIALVATFAGFSGWSLQRAASEVSAVTDPDYYAHGLSYHRAGPDHQAKVSLEWTVTPRLSGRTLAIEVRDADGMGVSGCHALLAFPEDRHGLAPLAPLTLADDGNGSYAAELPPGLPASIATTLTVIKAQATIRRQILINLGS